MPKISEEKRQARKAQILEAATRCFARDGFHRTTMEEVVRESGLSPGAIYCYFRSKQEMVEAISAVRHARDQALLDELASAASLRKGLDRLALALVRMLEDAKEKQRRKVSIQFWAESLHDARIRKVAERGLRQRGGLTAALRTAQRSGELPAGVDVESLSRVLFALFQGFILQQAWEPGLDSGAYVRTAMALIKGILSKAAPAPRRKAAKAVTGLL